jgi:hypothetical protein
MDLCLLKYEPCLRLDSASIFRWYLLSWILTIKLLPVSETVHIKPENHNFASVRNVWRPSYMAIPVKLHVSEFRISWFLNFVHRPEC